MSSSFQYQISSEKLAKKLLSKKYNSRNPSSLKYQYIGLIMENLIFNKNTHQVTLFKDYMIWDSYDEFLKRFYLKKESRQRVNKFSSFYKNYLKFFCIPTLKDVFPNEVVHTCSEKKAELFYNENYKRNKKDNSELKDCGLYQDSESDLEETKSDNNLSKRIFFNETARKKIEKNSPINTSIVLNESETKLKDDESGLLITTSELDSLNENSLRDIMTQMKKKNRFNLNNQKLILYANDNISSQNINKANKTKNSSSRNKSLDIIANNNNNTKNKNKQLKNYNVEKKENLNNNNYNNNNKNMIRNKVNKNEEQIKSNNFLLNMNNSKKLIKKNNNNSKNINSLNNINNNNNNNNGSNGSRNSSKNPQITSTINSNNYSRNNHLDKINNIKKTINLNLIKSKNLQTFLGKYNAHPLIYINQTNEKKSKNINKNANNKESIANSAKSIFTKNVINNNLKMASYNKYFVKNSSFSQVKLPKTNNTISNNINTNKKTRRILPYKDFHKSENESNKKNKNKNIINTKLSFEGILHNNNTNNSNNINNNSNNKRYNIINYNGEKHIHNINININNHINIGPKQFQDIFTFSDLVKMQNRNGGKYNDKKNNIYAFLKANNKNTNYISRNKNQSLDYNSLINNTNNNNKMNSATDIHNSVNKNNIYRTQYLVNKGKNTNIYNFKNKKSSKIKLTNDNNNNIFMALKSKI